jgi:hypothetical protein
METEAQKPQNQKNYENRPKHIEAPVLIPEHPNRRAEAQPEAGLINFDQYFESSTLSIVMKNRRIHPKESDYEDHKNVLGLPYGSGGFRVGHAPSVAVANQFYCHYSADPNNNGRRADVSDAYVPGNRHQPDCSGSQL